MRRKHSGDKRGKENRKCWDFLWMWGVCSWQACWEKFSSTGDSERIWSRKKLERSRLGELSLDNQLHFYPSKNLVEIFVGAARKIFILPTHPKVDYCGCHCFFHSGSLSFSYSFSSETVSSEGVLSALRSPGSLWNLLKPCYAVFFSGLTTWDDQILWQVSRLEVRAQFGVLLQRCVKSSESICFQFINMQNKIEENNKDKHN